VLKSAVKRTVQYHVNSEQETLTTNRTQHTDVWPLTWTWC